ncbi:beta-lactamase family protein [Paenibacillus doosanensis]|uniref:serine hydrolase domain-containing protein n=1 Tax=Paenibacillus doosanensis TaxID=1229154 RepID=UPI00217FBB30|nr:serine hydrolase domain-containing protein [Paenibacillus doosanensis]MCS7461348.1 beta-lactamase family protein [Paenibacillus doosanensis]
MTNPLISKRQDLIDLQIQVKRLLEELAEEDTGAGFQAAAYWHGEPILNVVAGSADAAGQRPVAADTLFVIQSCSKGVVSTAVHILAQQGKLAYDEKIAHYWPEFGTNGKENITLRQVLTHTAGIPLMPAYADMRLVADWQAMVCEMEKLEPIWEPGSKSGYHGLTFGWILGETASRADGRTIAQIIQDEIGKPLGIEQGLYLGAPAEAEARIAEISGEAVQIASLPDDMLFKRVLPPALVPVANPEWNSPWFHAAAVPAVNIVATAQALACMYASLIGQGVNGRRLLGQDAIAAAAALQFEGIDEVGLAPNRLGLGYSLGQEGDAMGGRPTAFGYSGLGGMIGYADPENRLAAAVLCNRMKVGRGKRSPDRLVTDLIRERLSLT